MSSEKVQPTSVMASGVEGKRTFEGPSTPTKSDSVESEAGVNPEEEKEFASETSWAALSQIVVAFFITFNSWGLINTFGVYQTYYTSSSSPLPPTNQSTISWIGSLQACLILSTLVIFGPMFDRGYARALLLCGIVLDVLGMMMTSLASKFWQLMLCQGLCMGLGHGCLYIVAVGQIAVRFRKRRWMALGIAQSGGSIGAIIYSEIFRSLQPTSAGAGWATRTIAFIMLGTLVLAASLLRPCQLPKPRKMFDASAFQYPPFLVFAIAALTAFMGFNIPFFFIQEYAIAHAHTATSFPSLAYSTLAILNAGSALGRIVPGFIADAYGLLNTYIICTLFTTIFGFIWIACRDFTGIIVFVVFYGIFSGGLAALQAAVLASLAPTPNLVGTWVGMGSLFASVGILLGNPLGGLIYDHSGWVGLQLWCACLVLACTIATVTTRILRGGMRLGVKV